jgi:hypothetical protein
MCLKFREEITNLFALINLINDDYEITFKFILFASNIRKEVCGVLDSFLSFLRKCEKREIHNMLFLMLDPIFKSLHLVSFFVG